MSGGEIKVKVGDKVPLQAQETDRDATKVVRATLFDLADFSVIAGAGSITLAHKSNGAYFDDSFTMPDIEKIFAQYLVFDADGTTPNTTGEKAVNDIFVQDDLDDAINDLNDIISKVPGEFQADIETSELQAGVEESNILTAGIEIDDDLTANVESDELTGTLENGDLTANVECEE